MISEAPLPPPCQSPCFQKVHPRCCLPFVLRLLCAHTPPVRVKGAPDAAAAVRPSSHKICFGNGRCFTASRDHAGNLSCDVFSEEITSSPCSPETRCYLDHNLNVVFLFLEMLTSFKSLEFIVAGSGREGVAAQGPVTWPQKGQAP